MTGRLDSRDFWERIAEGEMEGAYGEDLRIWLGTVAKRLLEADDMPAEVRHGAIVRAVGLSGRRDEQAPLREVVEVADSFLFIEDGERRDPRRGERMRTLIEAVRASGLVDHDVSDPELRKRIERILARKV